MEVSISGQYIDSAKPESTAARSDSKTACGCRHGWLLRRRRSTGLSTSAKIDSRRWLHNAGKIRRSTRRWVHVIMLRPDHRSKFGINCVEIFRSRPYNEILEPSSIDQPKNDQWLAI